MGNYHALLAKSPAFFAEQAGLYADIHLPPQHVLDAAAERTITGGFVVKAGNLCHGCFTYRSANGACLCGGE